MGWIGCVRCKKFRCDFVARNFALIAPVQPVLYRASCSNETIQNAPKHYKTHKNMSSGSNGVDRVRSLQKIPMRVRAMKFCINCTSSALFAPSFKQLRNKSKIHPNSTKRTKTWVLGPMGWIGCVRCEKFPCVLMAQTWALIAPAEPI